MYEELIVALYKYFEGYYEPKRGDALKAEAIHELKTLLEREKEKHQHTSEVAFAHEDEIKRLKRELDIKTRMEQAMTDIAQDFQQQLHDAQDELARVKQERDNAIASIPRCCLYCAKNTVCVLPVVDADSECESWEWMGTAKED